MKLTRIGLNPQEIASRESLFHVANGYLGMRACLEEGVPANVRSIRGTYLNAFYETYPVVYTERLYGFPQEAQTIVNVPDLQCIALTLDGEDFNPFSGTLDRFEQTLDMDAGQYIRQVLWRSPGGRETQIEFRRMASLEARELLTIQITVTPINWSGMLRIVSGQSSDVHNDGDPDDPRKASETKRMLQTVESGHENRCIYMQCETIQSKQSMACGATHTASGPVAAAFRAAKLQNTAILETQVTQGNPFSLVKWCVFTDSRFHAEPLPAAIMLARRYSKTPIETWYARQAERLHTFWASARITVQGPPALQSGADFAAYTLFQSAGPDGVRFIPSKGLSGEGYEGHYFWDTEIYMFPFFLLTNPQIARRLLDYRYDTLDGARRHARLMGHQSGALYPWRTITGSECSAYYPSGSAQYHINSDIAYTVSCYYFVTGDIEYIRDKGMEILLETARLWLDAGHFHNGQFRIDGVTGPDEYTCLVNNNYFTNLSVKHHMQNTLLLCERLRDAYPELSLYERYHVTGEELQAFQAVSEAIYLPYDETLGICAQDDTFLQKQRVELGTIDRDQFPLLIHCHPLSLYRRQVCKQADAVLAHFLYEDGIDDAVIRRTYEYYEAITTHDSSLSPCIFSMMAARIGDPEKALRYYLHSVHLDLDNTQRNTDDGIHAANMGGIAMGIVFGFAGLRIHADGLSLRPCIPKAVEGYAFPLQYRGRRIRVQVSHSAVTVRADGTDPVSLTVYNRKYTVAGEPLVIPLRQTP